MEPTIYRVLLLRDHLNSTDEIADALMNHLPEFLKDRRDWLVQRNLGYARKMVHLARIYGRTIVYESSEREQAHGVYKALLYRGLRLHPFGEPMPAADFDEAEASLAAGAEPEQSQDVNTDQNPSS